MRRIIPHVGRISNPAYAQVDDGHFLWHNPAIKRVDGNEYIGGTVREPAAGAKQVSEADGKSSRSGELKTQNKFCGTE